MFEIKEITVTASCSKNYQKAEFTMTAMVESDEDIAAVKTMCTQHALQLLETLPIKEESKTTVQAPVQQRTQYQTPRTNQPVQQSQGYAPRQQYQNNQYQFKPVSEAQIKYLNGLGYNGPIPQSWEEANQLLKQLKAERGIQ